MNNNSKGATTHLFSLSTFSIFFFLLKIIIHPSIQRAHISFFFASYIHSINVYTYMSWMHAGIVSSITHAFATLLFPFCQHYAHHTLYVVVSLSVKLLHHPRKYLYLIFLCETLYVYYTFWWTYCNRHMGQKKTRSFSNDGAIRFVIDDPTPVRKRQKIDDNIKWKKKRNTNHQYTHHTLVTDSAAAWEERKTNKNFGTCFFLFSY